MRKSLKNWIDLIEGRCSQDIQLGLERVSRVAERLGVLKTSAKVITIAGTNGKGSTVALLDSIYRTAGYQVGSYTSPHLVLANERIKVNQSMISDDDLVDIFEQIEAARTDIVLTYFETLTLAALYYFQQFKLDIILLEVGLGGRLDATNILSNDIAVITTIDFDHQEYLGDTLDKIGFEKAGIIQEGKPVIFGDEKMPSSILKQAQLKGSRVYCYGHHYKIEKKGNSQYLFIYQNEVIVLPILPLHIKSIGCAVMVQRCLSSELPITKNELIEGIKNTVLPGRFHFLSQPVPTLLDVAHNPQAAENLARYLLEYFKDYNIYAVFSALSDKNLIGLISPFKNIVTAWFPSMLDSKRSSESQSLINALQYCKVNFNLCYNQPVQAYFAACKEVDSKSLVLVYGSFLTVGSVLSALS